jgi:hypothetical protein
MLTCRDAYALIVRSVDDNRLPETARATLRQHLRGCARCREEYDTQHAVRRLLALHVEEPLPAGFDARLRARLRQLPEPSPRHVRQVEHPGHAGHRRAWAFRLFPIAATLVLILTDAYVQVRQGTHSRETQPRSSAVVDSGARLYPLPLPLAPPLSRSRRAGTSRHHQQPPPAPTATEEAGDALRLSDTQRQQLEAITDAQQQALRDILESTRKRVELERRQTDAAIARVLTPEQRRQYRDRGDRDRNAATRDRNAATRDRNASEGSSALPHAPPSQLPSVSPIIPAIPPHP